MKNVDALLVAETQRHSVENPACNQAGDSSAFRAMKRKVVRVAQCSPHLNIHPSNGALATPRRRSKLSGRILVLKVIQRCLTTAILLSSWLSFQARAAQADAILDSWLASQTNLQTWSADVIQTRLLKTLTQPLVSTGHVWVAIPNRFRWEIGQPAQTIALRRPEALFIIYPRLKRAEKYPLDDQRPGPWRDVLALLEASFPRSRAQLDSFFRVLSVTPTNGLWCVALQPKSAQARRMTPAINVSFHSGDYALTSTEMTFADGSIMRNDFTNAVLNPRLPDGCFDPALDPSFKVVEPSKP